MGELLPLFGADSDSTDDFTVVHNRFLQPLARTGAAVTVVDHLAKGNESRRLGPGGTVAKRRTVGGVSLRVVRVKPFTPGEGGAAELWVNKDRHGGVRDSCDPVPPGRDEQLAGTFLLGTADGETGVALWQVARGSLKGCSSKAASPGDEPEDFRPTTLMERASRAVEEKPGELTKTDVVGRMGCKKQFGFTAVAILEKEEYLRAEKKPRRRTVVYTSVKPYRQEDDPRSDQAALRDQLRAPISDEHPLRGERRERHQGSGTIHGINHFPDRFLVPVPP
jgi:hypothetical protein